MRIDRGGGVDPRGEQHDGAHRERDVMTTNDRPVIPPHGMQTSAPNGTPPAAWAVPQYQPTWQQTPPNPSPEPTPAADGSQGSSGVVGGGSRGSA